MRASQNICENGLQMKHRQTSKTYANLAREVLPVIYSKTSRDYIQINSEIKAFDKFHIS